MSTTSARGLATMTPTWPEDAFAAPIDAQALAREAVAAWAGREPGDWLRPWEPLTDSITKVIQTHIDRADKAEAELKAYEKWVIKAIRLLARKP